MLINLIGFIIANHNLVFKFSDYELFKLLRRRVWLEIYSKIWSDKAKEARESEEKAKSAPRELLKSDTQELQLRASLNPPSEDSPEEEVSRESHHSSMMTPDTFLRDSSKVLSEMPSPTLSTPEEKPSPLWTLSTLSRDKAEPSTDLEVDLHYLCYNYYNYLYSTHLLISTPLLPFTGCLPISKITSQIKKLPFHHKVTLSQILLDKPLLSPFWARWERK